MALENFEYLDNFETGRLHVGKNIHIHYEYLQRGKPVFLFLYGLGCEISHWKYQIQHFSKEFNHQPSPSILWLDYRGHGQSTELKKAKQISLDIVCEDIEKILKHLDIKSVVLLGQSMGGTIALKFAHMYPEHVEKLILQGAPPSGPSQTLDMGMLGKLSWLGLIKLNQKNRKIIKQGFTVLPKIYPFMKEMIRHFGFNPVLARSEDIDEYIKGILRMDPNVFLDLAAEMEKFEISQLQPPIKVPTLILAGERDFCVSLEKAKEMKACLPEAQMHVLENGSHCPHQDDPDKVNLMIENFVYK